MARKLVCGVGLNDVDYSTREVINDNGKQITLWTCPVYSCWKDMLKRCYGKWGRLKLPTYSGCSVSEEWHKLSNFKIWFDENYVTGWHLDKDLLLPGNKIYGPNTCLFLPRSLNNLLTLAGESSSLPFGVSLKKSTNKFSSRCCIGDGDRVNLGYFDSAEEAHRSWQLKKLEVISNYIKDFTEHKQIRLCLERLASNLKDDLKNNKETKSLTRSIK